MRNILTAAFAMLALLAVSALAGDYHSGTTLFCEDCHIMHASQTHGYNQNGGGTFVIPTPGAHEFLLRDEPNAMCLKCHDGSNSAPDVLGVNQGNVPTNGRQAGALNRDNVAPYFSATGHTLYSTATAPGGTWTPSGTHGLECIHCHTQHGRSATIGGVSESMYRNVNFGLVTGSTAGITYAVGAAPTLTKDVWEVSASFGGDHYSPNNVEFNEPDQTKSGYANYCKQCHTNFHGTSADANMRNTTAPAGTEWVRHPTADVNIGASGGGHSAMSTFKGNLYRTKVMTNSGDWGTQGTAITNTVTDYTPSCFSCHKAHGNQNAFGLIFATGAVAIGEEGDGTNYRQLCGQCHRQGPAL